MGLKVMEFSFHRRLTDAFEVGSGEVVTLVGAGGKTSFMYALAKELVEEGKKVITTTTTKIWLPSKEDTEHLIIDAEGKITEKDLLAHKHVTCVAGVTEEGKGVGVEPKAVENWLSTVDVDCIVVEADGSRGKPLKAPAAYEPVIPPGTTLYIPVVGVDAVGRRLSEEHVHRPRIVAKLAGIKLGDEITPTVIGTVMRHYIEMCPRLARATPFINKVSTRDDREKALSIVDNLRGEKSVFGDVFKKKFWRSRSGT